MKESVMPLDVKHSQKTTADSVSQVVAVQEAARPLSDREMARGVAAMGIAGAVGGGLGMLVGGLGDKIDSEKLTTVFLDCWRAESRRKWPVQLGGKASKIGGLILAGISMILAGSANFFPSRKTPTIDGKLPDAPVPMSDAKVETLPIPQSHVITLPATHDGHVQAAEMQRHQAM